MKYVDYLEQAKNKKISEHFTLYEVCYSYTALKNNIDNIPTPQIILNATKLASMVLEPIRKHFNKPLTINCLYRSPILNTKVGGAVNSQHRFGQAADFYIEGVKIEDIFQWCKANLKFDQLIQEGTWIHISYAQKNRQQSLRFVNGKYIAG